MSKSSPLNPRISRRRFTQGVAATAAAAGMAAPAVTQTGAQEQVTIKYWTHTHPPMVDLNQELVEAFMADNPDINVEYEIIPNNEFATKMLTSMGTGVGPDIINMDDNQMRSIYIPRGLVQPVDPVALGYASLDDLKAAFIPAALTGATDADGNVYGLPSEFNVTAAIINTAAFEEAGLDASAPPASWDDVWEQGPQLTIEDGGMLTRRGFGWVYLHQGWYHNQLGTLMLQTGGRYVDEDGTTVTANSPEMVQALSIWHDAVHVHGIEDPNVANTDATVPYQDVLDGNIAMSFFNPWGMGLIEADSEIGDNWAIVPMPQVNPDAGVTPLYAYYFAINAQTTDEAKKDAANRLIGYLTSFGERWLADVNFIQPKVGWEESEAAQAMPFIEVWSSEMLKGQFQPVIPNAEQVDAIMMSTIQSSLLNAVPPQEALDEAVPQIEAAIAD